MLHAERRGRADWNGVDRSDDLCFAIDCCAINLGNLEALRGASRSCIC